MDPVVAADSLPTAISPAETVTQLIPLVHPQFYYPEVCIMLIFQSIQVRQRDSEARKHIGTLAKSVVAAHIHKVPLTDLYQRFAQVAHATPVWLTDPRLIS